MDNSYYFTNNYLQTNLTNIVIIDSFETKEKILKEFLLISTIDGWNENSLIKSFENCNIDIKFLDILFERKCLDVAEFYIDYYNSKTLENVSKIESFSEKKIGEKIKIFLYLRFEIELQNQTAIRRLINFYINPKNLLSSQIGIKPSIQSLGICYKIADFMWKSINDQSTDFNFYTKRITLAKIIFRSIGVFIKDDSENFDKTKKFIDNQIEKVVKFARFKNKAKSFSLNILKGMEDNLLNEDKTFKSPIKIIKSLPFIRLIKF